MRLTTEKTIRGRWSREDLALYALLAGGAVIMGVVVYFVVQAYEPPLEEGKVTEKDFTAAHWESGYNTEYHDECGLEVNIDGDLVMACHTVSEQVYEAHHTWHDDDYDILLYACKTNDKGEEKCRTSWKDVPALTYSECQIGSLYKKRTASCLPQ